jgi:hypothetical protein
VVLTPVGTATLRFSSRASGTLYYTVDGITQAKGISRFVFDQPVSNCSL